MYVIVFVLMLHVVHNVQFMGIVVQLWHLEMLRISVLCSLSTFMFISTWNSVVYDFSYELSTYFLSCYCYHVVYTFCFIWY